MNVMGTWEMNIIPGLSKYKKRKEDYTMKRTKEMKEIKSKEETEKYLAQLLESGELSDEALDGVNGGKMSSIKLYACPFDTCPHCGAKLRKFGDFSLNIDKAQKENKDCLASVYCISCGKTIDYIYRKETTLG